MAFGAEKPWELEKELEFAFQYPGPIAIRYPRGEGYQGLEEYQAPVEFRRGELISEGEGIAPAGSWKYGQHSGTYPG